MFGELIEADGYIPQQVFNCDETRLFWKKMPQRTYITMEEKKSSSRKISQQAKFNPLGRAEFDCGWPSTVEFSF